jgi:Tfp pilus assembly protein PilO
MRLFLPIILIAAAIGLFALYTNGTYQHIKTLQVRVGSFNEALDTAQSLKQQRDALLSKRNTFSAENIQKLERILPDNVDNIRFVIDINNIAARHSLSLKNVSLGTLSDSKNQRAALSVGASGDPVGSAEIGFSLTATYEDFLIFLQDLEHSLRIVDISKISFKPATGSQYDFSMTIKTYWLH